jgi:hypothetical protein
VEADGHLLSAHLLVGDAGIIGVELKSN